jgi:hypothetical protein
MLSNGFARNNRTNANSRRSLKGSSTNANKQKSELRGSSANAKKRRNEPTHISSEYCSLSNENELVVI